MDNLNNADSESELSWEEALRQMKNEMEMSEADLSKVATENEADMAPEDALNIMRQDLQAEYVHEKTTEVHHSTPERPEIHSSAPKRPGYVDYSQKALKVFQQISNLMGDFFNSIKDLNSNFAVYADAYYSEARSISANMEKRNLTEQEYEDLTSNILAGLMIEGVGTLLKTYKLSVVLDDVKRLLRQDAKYKLDSIKAIKSQTTSVLEIAQEQFNDYARSPHIDVEELYDKFDALRLTMYVMDLADFLNATYEAALEDRFQNEFAFPTLFNVNQALLNQLLGLNEKYSSIEARTNYYRTHINEALDGILNCIKTGASPSPAQLLLAKDKGLMAVAIYDCNPEETICITDEGELIGVNPDNLVANCTDGLKNYLILYEYGKATASTVPIAALLNQNEALKEAAIHIDQLYEIPMEYTKREKIMALNLILAGVLGFLVGMANDFKWYWALLIGVVALVLMRVLSPVKSTIGKFINKLTYVERAVRVTAMQNAGYTEPVELYALQSSNQKAWILGVIGAVIGLLGGPIGALVGLFVGLGIAGLLSEKDENEDGDYDYTKISTGSSWKGYIITAVLGIGIILSLLLWLIPTGDKSTSSHGSGERREIVADTGYYEEVVTVEGVSPGDEAKEALQNIYAGKGDTYTKSFNGLLDEVSRMEDLSGSLILDCDLLDLSQESCDPTLDIKGVKEIDKDNVEVKGTLHNCGNTFHRVYVMKREGGVFKIDDFIDEGESTRKFLRNEINEAKKYVASTVAASPVHNWTLRGRIGEYPVVFYLDTDKEGIKGKYAYLSTLNKYGDSPRHYFYLDGLYDDSDGRIGLTSYKYKEKQPFESIVLKVSKNGSSTTLSGTLTNINVNHEFPLELQLQ